jgi:hypothetical protein
MSENIADKVAAAVRTCPKRKCPTSAEVWSTVSPWRLPDVQNVTHGRVRNDAYGRVLPGLASRMSIVSTQVLHAVEPEYP